MMDDETRAALDASIEHWRRDNERALTADAARIGSGHCALCDLFWSRMCSGCPVYERTGKTHCEDSPYDEIVSALARWLNAEDAARLSALGYVNAIGTIQPHPAIRLWRAREAFLLAARDERQFLESLRKRTEQ